jgi:hypothetical protein
MNNLKKIKLILFDNKIMDINIGPKTRIQDFINYFYQNKKEYIDINILFRFDDMKFLSDYHENTLLYDLFDEDEIVIEIYNLINL